MTDILVNLSIPIPLDRVVPVPALIFARWLPIGRNEGVTIFEGDLELTLWFDTRTTDINAEELESHVNVTVHKVYADVLVKAVPLELADFISSRDYGEALSKECERLQQEYDELAWRILSLTVSALNRFLSYVRARKGQYWLLEHRIDRGTMYSSFAQFSGRARIDDGQWFRFGPSPLDKRTIEWTPESRFITRQEWEEVCDHVRSGRNPPLAATILATAEYLAAKGHSRSAITEAITALEVALFEFASDPKVDSVLAPKLRDRLDLNTLKTQVEKFGLTRSISYLVPILIPEAVIPQPILKGCQKAIAIRQNVVHNGQREVPERLLKSSLRAVRQMCELFATLTEDPDLAAAKEP